MCINFISTRCNQGSRRIQSHIQKIHDYCKQEEVHLDIAHPGKDWLALHIYINHCYSGTLMMSIKKRRIVQEIFLEMHLEKLNQIKKLFVTIYPWESNGVAKTLRNLFCSCQNSKKHLEAHLVENFIDFFYPDVIFDSNRM